MNIQNELNELREINRKLIEQNEVFIRVHYMKNPNWKIKHPSYEAGYKAALEFVENQFKRIEQGSELYHLEGLNEVN